MIIMWFILLLENKSRTVKTKWVTVLKVYNFFHSFFAQQVWMLKKNNTLSSKSCMICGIIHVSSTNTVAWEIKNKNLSPSGTGEPDTQSQWFPARRRWISSVGSWGLGSGPALLCAAWCAWCCCRCGPSWRGGAGEQCQAACWSWWRWPGCPRGAPVTPPCPSATTPGLEMNGDLGKKWHVMNKSASQI